MAEPVVVAVPPELLAGMAEAQRDGVIAMREARAEAVATREAVAALRKAFDDHATREEPALQAHADYLRRMADADADATAEARQARRKAETEEVKRRTELYGLAVKVIVALGSLIIAALAGAGATTALGGP